MTSRAQVRYPNVSDAPVGGRSFAGRVAVFVLIVVILEGALRKWMSPSLGVPLMLFRDAAVVVAIVNGVVSSKFLFNRALELALIVWTLVVVLWGLIQVFAGVVNPIVILIGYRSWLLYLWFSVLCFRSMKGADLTAIFRVSLISLPFVAALSVFQHFMPVWHPVNLQPDGGDETTVFQVVSGVVRASGTFSFVTGYTQYLAFISPLVLVGLVGHYSIPSGRKPIGYVLVLIYIVGMLMSGSRGAFAFFALIAGAFYVALFFLGRQVRVLTLVVPVFAVVLGLLVATFFSEAVEANLTRIDNASVSEDSGQRLLQVVFGGERLWADFDVLGQGIGAGSNAARGIAGGRAEGFLLGEYEVERVVNEGGLIGVLFMVLKLGVGIIGILKSFRILAQHRMALPFLFWVYLLITIFTGQITGQITVHAFFFLALGVGWKLIDRSSYLNRESRT